MGNPTQELPAQGGSGVSILGDTQNVMRCGANQPA